MTDQNRSDIAVLVGSLRKQAFSRKVALALQELAPTELALEIVEIGQLPLYNQDLEVEPAPAEWSAFRQRIARAHGVLLITPEYNRGPTAALKNAIDVASRPPGKSVWLGKPAAILSTSPGPVGGFGANHSVRQAMVCLGVPVLPQELYLGSVDKQFDETGKLTGQPARDNLSKLLGKYAEWIKRTRS